MKKQSDNRNESFRIWEVVVLHSLLQNGWLAKFNLAIRARGILTFEAEWDEELLGSIQLYSEKVTEKWFTKQTSEVNDYLPLKYKSVTCSNWRSCSYITKILFLASKHAMTSYILKLPLFGARLQVTFSGESFAEHFNLNFCQRFS